MVDTSNLAKSEQKPVSDLYGVLRPADGSLTGAGTPSPRLKRVPGPRTRFAPVLTGVIL